MSVDLRRESLDTPSTPKASTEHSVTSSKTAAEVLPVQDADRKTRMDRVLQSDIGINTLLTRLKQSISSARDLSGFFKERAALEEKHFHGILRLTRSTQDLLGRAENRQGSFAFNYREMGVIHERMAKNSEDFAQSLLAMSEELQDLATQSERGRKHWKHVGLEAEQRSQDADTAMEKSKQRYFSFAEQYDRVRTGERQGGKFGLKGPKSAAQQEESLLAKAESADQEYRSRVEAAQSQRQELLTSSRPQAVRELQNIVNECDAAVSMQLQKFGMLNEKLLLGNGLCISPLKSSENTSATGSRSLREIAQAIDNHRDFENDILSHSREVGPVPGEIKYEKHPALVSTVAQHMPTSNTFGHNPQRSDTGFSTMGGPVSSGAQTSGVVGNQLPPQNQYSGPQTSSSVNAPQLPQIGALSTGQDHLDGTRTEPTQARGDYEYRNNPSLAQHRQGQPSYGATTAYTPESSTNYRGSGESGLTGTGVGRGHSTATSISPPPGPMMAANPYSHTGRGPSLGSPSEFRSDGHGGRGPSLGSPTEFRSDGRSPPTGPTFQMAQPNPRGPTAGSVIPETQQNLRSPQSIASYQTQQQNPRALPSQANTYGASGPGGSVSNGNTRTGVLGAGTMGPARGPGGRPNLPPLRPVFGISLDELFRRDGSAVPAIVYQCVQAVDLFGLNVEGIYRVSGSAQHIMELQALFDHDSTQIDFRNSAAFYNDINSVTTLLKHFLRDLPDPILTSAQYNSFIQAAKIEEDIVRRDSLHAIINSLPDPNYATLRTVVLHLYRIAQNSAQNRMTASNLAIVFGPTLMGGHGGGPGGDIQDAGWQARVVETILHNTLQIFDDDD